jgi:hypothetical protein
MMGAALACCLLNYCTYPTSTTHAFAIVPLAVLAVPAPIVLVLVTAIAFSHAHTTKPTAIEFADRVRF